MLIIGALNLIVDKFKVSHDSSHNMSNWSQDALSVTDWSRDALTVTGMVPDGPRECLPIVFSTTGSDVREKICHPLHWEVVLLRVTEQVEQSCDEHNLWKKRTLMSEIKEAVEREDKIHLT